MEQQNISLNVKLLGFVFVLISFIQMHGVVVVPWFVGEGGGGGGEGAFCFKLEEV